MIGSRCILALSVIYILTLTLWGLVSIHWRCQQSFCPSHAYLEDILSCQLETEKCTAPMRNGQERMQISDVHDDRKITLERKKKTTLSLSLSLYLSTRRKQSHLFFFLCTSVFLNESLQWSEQWLIDSLIKTCHLLCSFNWISVLNQWVEWMSPWFTHKDVTCRHLLV